MIPAQDYSKESERLKDLESYSILDTLPEDQYDNLTRIAAEICGTPISLVTLLDKNRQWFKSRHGLDLTETPREAAFCAHAIHHPDEIMIVEDSRMDERFMSNPLVEGDPHFVFYAGVPLISERGMPLGTLCVIDHEPKRLSESQLDALRALSCQVMSAIEARKEATSLQTALKELEHKNAELEKFAAIAAHDIKSPLTAIIGFSNLITLEYGEALTSDGRDMLRQIDRSAQKLRRLVDSLLEYSTNTKIVKEKRTNTNLLTLFEHVTGLFVYNEHCSVTLHTGLKEVVVNRMAIQQILINLLSNAIKYNDKTSPVVEIRVDEHADEYIFSVKDNGPGIPEEYHVSIFEMFNMGENKDRENPKGNGLGLATVKKLVHALGGTIDVQSEVGAGSEFVFSVKKPEGVPV